MADVTVTPSTFELVLTQETLGLGFTIFPSAFQLVVTVPPSKVTYSFPRISRGPVEKGFIDEPSGTAVLIGDTASGYLVLNKIATFEPRTFKFELPNVPDVDKLIVMAFYESHKDKTFPWYNDQDGLTYEVCFLSRPECRIEGRKDFWRIGLEFLQVTS